MSGRATNTLPFGLAGGEVIDDTSAHTGEWGVIQVTEDAVISAITMPDVTNSDAYTGVSFAQGFIIYGKVTSITLTSGSVAAFNY